MSPQAIDTIVIPDYRGDVTKKILNLTKPIVMLTDLNPKWNRMDLGVVKLDIDREVTSVTKVAKLITERSLVANRPEVCVRKTSDARVTRVTSIHIYI